MRASRCRLMVFELCSSVSKLGHHARTGNQYLATDICKTSLMTQHLHRGRPQRLTFPVQSILAVAMCATACSSPVPAEPTESTQPDRRLVVTVDDLPHQGPSATFLRSDRYDTESLRAMNQDLVTALTDAKVPAIGFVNEGKLRGEDGSEAPERAALLEIWLKAGLELGNHSYWHHSLHQAPLDEYQADVLKGERTTARLTAHHNQPKPRFFRHPYLHTGRTQTIKRKFAEFLKQHDYRIAPVTSDNSEWIFSKAYALALNLQNAEESQALAQRVKAEYLDYMIARAVFSERQSIELLGREVPQILLIHDNLLNADAVGELVERYRDRGYRMIPLAEALEDPAFERPDGYEGPAGISWIERWAFAEGRDKTFFANSPRTPQWILELAEIDGE